ncbi:alpha/beta hydrolase [Kitasatospora nipponensis]|uniref:Alpha/beta hydrolase n=1 Tax=Kitasatospora nipponensis TaxID=258049 RepID=A0ABN1WSX9_9ACTN
MPLHPQLRALRERRAAAGTPPLYTLSLEQARAADLADLRAAGGEPEPVADVRTFEIPGPGGPLPLRLYRPTVPAGPQAGPQPERGPAAPVLVYLFGGGWTLGCLDTGDAICRALTNAAGCATLAVGYRLAPEHPFPAALEDCYAAVGWLAEHAAELGLDPARVAIGGDSAGGNLAAATTLLCRGRGGPALRHQLLVYPNTDYRPEGARATADEDPLLFNQHSVQWYWRHYLADEEHGSHPLASPLRAEDLSGLPAATVITAEFDPLREEGEAYAERLREAGVPVAARRYEGMAHGFFAMAGVLDDGRAAQRYAAAALRAAFAGDGAGDGSGDGSGDVPGAAGDAAGR